MNWWIILTIIIILVNGFFVATEFALVKVRMSQLAVKIKEWNKSALLVEDILKKIDIYLSTTQLWITLCWLALGRIWWESLWQLIISMLTFFGSTLSPDAAEAIGIPVAFILLTMVQVIIGELIPKCLAIQNPMKYAFFSAKPLRILYRILRPLIRLMQIIYRFLLRLIWIDAIQVADVHTEEELKLLLTESEEHGELKPSSNELIQNVFSFDDREVRHIYTPRKQMSAIDIAWDCWNIIKYMIREGYSRYPIYEHGFDNMIWVLYAKDVMQYFVMWKVTHEIIRKIVRPYHVVPLSQSIESLLHDMQTMHSHIALVQNEFGEIIGMVTMEDIVEELIWDVQDENDTEQQPYTILEDGTWVIQWQVSISTINEILPEPLEESDAYTTLGGYLVDLRGRIPVKWEVLEDEFYEYRIENMRKHQIQWVHMSVKK
jgi:CBS domain containing-hemolysin-like protein